MLVTVLFIIALVLVAAGGLLTALDAAITVQSRADILDLAQGARFPASLREISADPGAHLNAMAFLRITTETTAAVLVTLAFSTLLDTWWLALLISALMMTAVSFVLVGTSPRSVGRAHARALLRPSAPLIHALRVLLGPLADALVALGNRVTPSRARSAAVDSEEQLLSIVDEATALDVLEEDDRELIHSIFQFNDTLVREVMIPRTDMVTIDASATLESAMGLLLARGVSRIPVVVDGDADEVTGVLYLRDVARSSFESRADAGGLTAAELARPALFVPESKKADEMLRQMQLESNHLAMVVDEYGGIAGLVTLEDLIEELVGDISDEYDREVAMVEELGDGRFRVSARLAVDELGELFDLQLDDEDVDSVGGLVAKLLGRLPERGQVAQTRGLTLTAERTEGRRGRLSTVIVEREGRQQP
ncbi:hemolysin family protein [Microbacterium sp. STN6]|uniref:hemolysin family protein n=1 Tax=Microbacterium sp. STN6 TaxID=2995588 RepID=UPI0022608C9D|nr:hemolysin family protein [Microbacterium sp. STN6]MCX7522311.1 hemolysin family protein [Microbacterium sp. STN6]